jgi:hypothetical protein
VKIGRCESGLGNDHGERLGSYKGETQGPFYECRHYGSRQSSVKSLERSGSIWCSGITACKAKLHVIVTIIDKHAMSSDKPVSCQGTRRLFSTVEAKIMEFAGVLGLLLGLLRCNDRFTISKLYSVIGARLACQDIVEYLHTISPAEYSERDNLHYGPLAKVLISALTGTTGDLKARNIL